MKILILLFILMVTVTKVHSTGLSVGSVFSDQMVLQRGQEVVFWGKGKSGQVVQLSVGETTRTSTVDSNGKWLVRFPELPTGGPYEILVSSAEEAIVLTDVLVGDLWVASGQSNMEWKVDWKIDNWQQEKNDSQYSNIRFFEIDNSISMDPLDELNGSGWSVAGPDTVGGFSAVAWFFAKNNHMEEGVPVGIIDSTWGGTPAEAWTPLNALRAVNGYISSAEDIAENKDQWFTLIEANSVLEQQKWRVIQSDEFLKQGVHTRDFDDVDWKHVNLPFTKPQSDIVWLRKNVSLSSVPDSASLFLGEINELAKIFVNGEMVAEKTWLDKTEVIMIPSSLLVKGVNTIAVRAANGWDNQVFVGRENQVWLQLGETKLPLEKNWRVSNSIEPKVPIVERMNETPAVLYNAMIHPLIGLPIKGVIWYQGESNVERASEYGGLFAEMIRSWRETWGIGDFPFVYVQLASFLQQQDRPQDSQWALLREQQTNTLSQPMTAMAVTIDIGDADDIHPRNKQEVGRRLWLAAKSLAYEGSENISSPMFRSVTSFTRESLILEFSTPSPLMKNSEPVQGFELAGLDGIYYSAQAKLNDAKSVEVSSENVPSPKYVRYAWADNSSANLYNEHNLPAVPFRYEPQALRDDF